MKNGSTYQDLPEAKRHFSNWFNVNLKKKSLSAFLEEQHKAAKRAKAEVSKLIPKTDEFIDTLLQRQCSDVQQVIVLKEKLLSHQGLYQRKLDYLFNPEERAAVEGVILDIEKLSSKITKASIAKRLDWFCQQKNRVANLIF